MAGAEAEAAAAAADVSDDGDLVATVAAATAATPTDPMAQMMVLLKQVIQGMPANIAAAVKVDRPSSHLENVKLDIRNFSRTKTFTNKHDAWREWKNRFIHVIYTCDNHFGDYLSGLEKKETPVDAVEDLNLTQAQLSATLFNRLQAVTTGTANAMVMNAKGNGCEAWRLPNKAGDPQTDQRLTKAIMDVVNYKSKAKTSRVGSSNGSSW